MNDAERDSYLCHPALWPRSASQVSLPMTERSLPAWWRELDEAADEAELRNWMAEVFAWLEAWDAFRIELEVGEKHDRRKLAEVGATVDRKGVYRGPWSSSIAAVLLDINPQYCSICDSNGALLLEVFETWDSVVIHCTDESKEDFDHRVRWIIDNGAG
jgi:hypothetical protein